VIPANGMKAPVPERYKVLSYPTHEDHGFVWIWWGENPPADLNPPRFFGDIDEQFSYTRRIDHYPGYRRGACGARSDL